MTLTVPAPTDAEVLDALEPALGPIRGMTRSVYPYATSAPLEELVLELHGGRRLDVIFKDLAWERLLDDARRVRPSFLHEPRRSIETHRRLLEPLGVGPRCVATVSDDAAGRHWLFTEKVPGVELWQIGERSTWQAVAAWLARFHARFAGRAHEARAANPHLIAYDAATFERWADRARAALAVSRDARAPLVLARLERYGPIADALASVPATFLHGDMHASNVLVRASASGVDVWPVDWELAATGPAALDLAALTSGWSDSDRLSIVRAYHDTAGTPAWDELVAQVDRCRVHLALQWLGWGSDWQPPVEHARDWIAEAVDALQALDR